jgi:ParB family transcriptional regulator, chromosome partitioning protein
MNKKSKKSKTVSDNKKRKKNALGRGLNALFPDIGDSVDSKDSDYFLCDINNIKPNPYQPRRIFLKDDLEELSRSIKEQGVIQPIIVRKNDVGYELVAGERRLRASKAAGLKKIPTVVKDATNIELLQMSIVENIQRQNLNPMEEAEAYQRLMDEFNLTQEQTAQKIGKNRSTVANFIRLCRLPEEIKARLRDKVLTMGHARALLSLETSAKLNSAFKTVVSKGLSVRETEALVKKMKSKKKPQKKPLKNSNDIYFSHLAEELSRQLGTKVNIKRRGQKGKLEIEFYNNDDLDKLIEILKG